MRCLDRQGDLHISAKNLRERWTAVVAVLASNQSAAPLIFTLKHQQIEGKKARRTTMEKQILELRPATTVYAYNFAIEHSSFVDV
jgi:hypothetical protein